MPKKEASNNRARITASAHREQIRKKEKNILNGRRALNAYLYGKRTIFKGLTFKVLDS